MSKKREKHEKISTQRRHRQSEINLAFFLFQQSYQGNYHDINDVISSQKIKSDKKWWALNARKADGMPILINCIKGSEQKSDENDYLQCIKKLISTDAIDLNSKDKSHGRTALHWSVALNKTKICQYLVENGARLDICDAEYETPLQIAIKLSLDNLVQLLCANCHLETPALTLNEPDKTGNHPLFNAVLAKSIPIFETLLTTGADENCLTTSNGKSLLLYIIENSLDEFLKVLLKFNINLYPEGKGKTNVIHLAAKNKESMQLEFISNVCSMDDLESVDHLGRTPLFYAVQHNCHKNVELLLKLNVDINKLDNERKSVLHCTSGHLDSSCVDIILSSFSDLLDLRDNNQLTALHMAVKEKNAIIVKSLLDAGADMNVVDTDKHNLIHYATEYTSPDCLAQLVAAGLSVNIPDRHNVYPLHYAVRLKAHEDQQAKLTYLQKFLDTTNVDVDVYDDQGSQPIHWAVSMGFVEAVKKLLINAVSVNSTTKEGGLTSLHLACRYSQLDCLNVLLRSPDVDINKENELGYTPLMEACALGDSNCTELLLNYNANPNHIALDGKTPVYIAAALCKDSSVDCLWALSLKGANLDSKGANGLTPLQVACVNRNEACLKFLLSSKCNVNTILFDEENHTALDFALENRDYRCIRLLQRHSARTSAYILNNAACVIQSTWRYYKSRTRTFRTGTLSDHKLEEIEIFRKKSLTVEYNVYQKEVHIPKDVEIKCAIDVNNKPSNKDKEVNIQNVSLTERHLYGNKEIDKTKHLMRKTEELLVSMKAINTKAGAMINSKAFQTMKSENRESAEYEMLKTDLSQDIRRKP